MKPRRGCANRPRAPCSPPPMATSWAPPCTPCVSRLDPHFHPLGLTLRTRYPAQCTTALGRAPTPPPRRRRRARGGAGLTATSTSPHPSTLRAQQPEEIQVGTPC
jgi:hypothetical protein